MNIELKVGLLTLQIQVTNDFEVKGSYDPFEVSDWDYYGYRETDWEILSGEIEITSRTIHDPTERVFMSELSQAEIDHLIKWNYDKMTPLVQKEIDKLKGEI